MLSAIPSGLQITIKYQYIYLNLENNGLKLSKEIKKWILFTKQTYKSLILKSFFLLADLRY